MKTKTAHGAAARGRKRGDRALEKGGVEQDRYLFGATGKGIFFNILIIVLVLYSLDL